MSEKNSPIWAQLDAVPHQYPWLDHDEECEVCVIGGGLTGALCALKLAQQGAEVMLITSGQVGYGATANAMPCAEYDGGASLSALNRRLGRQTALKLFELGINALDGLEEIAFGLGEKCSFSRRDCLLFTDDPNDLEQLNREYIERRNAGFDCSFVSRNAARDIFSFELCGGIISKGLAAEFDPYIFTQLCVERAVSLGARVYENTKAMRLELEGETAVIQTSTHRQITAGRVVVASGSACADAVEGLAYPRTYFMAASRPVNQLSGWPGRCVIRSFGSPRMTIAASPDSRICVCGLDTSVVDEHSRLGGVLRLPSLHEKRFSDLTDYVRGMFPQIYIPEFEAVSAFRSCRSADGLPVIGSFEAQPSCIFAACCGAGGVLMSVTAAEIAASLCSGETPGLAELFSPERRSLRK